MSAPRKMPGRSAFRSGASASGFTLIEVLVVMLIIGIVSGIAVLSLRTSSQAGAHGAAQRFRAVLDAVALDALASSRDYGLLVWQRGYAFVQLNDKDKWVAAKLPREAGQATHRLAEGLRASLRVGDQDVSLTPRREDGPPQVLVLSNGEMTPFEIGFESDTAAPPGQAFRVTADAVGHLSTVKREGP